MKPEANHVDNRGHTYSTKERNERDLKAILCLQEIKKSALEIRIIGDKGRE